MAASVKTLRPAPVPQQTQDHSTEEVCIGRAVLIAVPTLIGVLVGACGADVFHIITGLPYCGERLDGNISYTSWRPAVITGVIDCMSGAIASAMVGKKIADHYCSATVNTAKTTDKVPEFSPNTTPPHDTNASPRWVLTDRPAKSPNSTHGRLRAMYHNGSVYLSY